HFRREQSMKRTLLSQLALLLAGLPMFGQIVNTTLQSHLNPTPGGRRYGDLWAEHKANGKEYAYLGSDQGNGVQIIDISNPDAPVLVATYAPANSGDMEDVKVVNNIGYFASYSGNGGIHIVDVTNPASPQFLSAINSGNGGYDRNHNIWVDNGILYTANYGQSPGMKAFNVSNPQNPILLW